MDRTFEIACSGTTHRVRWTRGALELLDHDPEAERALAAFGAEIPACVRLLGLPDREWSRAELGALAGDARNDPPVFAGMMMGVRAPDDDPDPLLRTVASLPQDARALIALGMPSRDGDALLRSTVPARGVPHVRVLHPDARVPRAAMGFAGDDAGVLVVAVRSGWPDGVPSAIIDGLVVLDAARPGPDAATLDALVVRWVDAGAELVPEVVVATLEPDGEDGWVLRIAAERAVACRNPMSFFQPPPLPHGSAWSAFVNVPATVHKLGQPVAQRLNSPTTIGSRWCWTASRSTTTRSRSR